MAIFVALGCSSSGTPGGFDGVDPAPIRTVNRNWVNGATSVVTPPGPPSPPGGDVVDTSAILGHWYVNRGGARFTLFIEVRSGHLTGTLARDGSSDAAQPIEQVVWYPSEGKLFFRAEEEGKALSYAVDVIDGTLIGRYALDAGDSSGHTHGSPYSGHLMGWRGETFDADISSRVFDIVIDDGRFVRLRIERDASDPLLFTNEFKLKATTARGSDGELPALPITIRSWDGKRIVFDLPNSGSRQRFNGTVSGRYLTGTMVEGRTGGPIPFAGTRANVLSYGLRSKTVEARREWQERVRRTLYRL